MADIQLTQGKVAIVDSDMAELIGAHKWCFAKAGYAKRRKPGGGTILMHRVIARARPGEEVDHINRNRLDNRSENLRIVSRSENVRNRVMKGFETVGHSSGYAVRIGFMSKRHYVGRFKTIEEAHAAREGKLKELGITHGGKLVRN
jgi:hypothetical protein